MLRHHLHFHTYPRMVQTGGYVEDEESALVNTRDKIVGLRRTVACGPRPLTERPKQKRSSVQKTCSSGVKF